MALSDYQEHLFRLAGHTLQQLRDHGLEPTAEHYSVWFTASQGFSRELAAEIRRLRQREGPISHEEMAILYEKHMLATRALAENQVGKIRDAISATHSAMQEAADSAETYGGTLDSASSRLANGDPTELVHLVSELMESTSEMREKAKSLQSELIARQNEVEDLRLELEATRKANEIDALTGIGNRRFFDTALSEALAEANQENTPLSLLVADVDHFKAFNDNHGHQMGDIILKLMAGLLSRQVKGKDIVARYGGEEFALVLPETSLEGATALAQSICETVAKQRPRIKSTQQELEPLTLSIGVALLRPPETGPDLFARADRCLYLAKAGGRNCVRNELDLGKAESKTAA